MKKIISILITITFLFSQLITLHAQERTLVITEVGAHESSGNEWVEIYNASANDIDVAGYKFLEDATKHSLKETTVSILHPQTFALIVQDPNKFLDKHPDITLPLFDSSWGSLSEDGEEIALVSSAGEILDQVIYGAVTTTSSERSLDYMTWAPSVDDNSIGIIFQEPIPDLTTDNLQLITQESGDGSQESGENEQMSNLANEQEDVSENYFGLSINEILVDPVDGEKEWVELFNGGDVAITLDGLELHDSVSKITTLAGQIKSHGYFVYILNSAKLNNSGDSVLLKNGDEIISQLTYSTATILPDEGQSLALYENTWHVSITPTPESMNVITKTVTLGGSQEINKSINQEITSENAISYKLTPKLSEILPNPIGSDAINEYIEIVNPSSEGINLKGYILEDLFGTQYIFDSYYLGPGLYYAVDRYVTGIVLDNEKEKVFLKDENGKTIDTVEVYKGIPENATLQLIQNKWKVSILPTKNLPNALVEPNVAPKINVNCTGEEKFNSTITCDGSDSVDKNKDSLFFEWSLLHNKQLLSITHIDTFNFTPKEYGTYVLSLKVSDGKLESVFKKEIKISNQEIKKSINQEITSLNASSYKLKDILCPSDLKTVTVTDVVTHDETLTGDPGFMIGNPAREVIDKDNESNIIVGDLVTLSGKVTCKQGMPRLHLTKDSLVVSAHNQPITILDVSNLDHEIGSLVRIKGTYVQETKNNFTLSSDDNEILVSKKFLENKIEALENVPMSVTGIVSMSGKNFILIPRRDEDIALEEIAKAVNETRSTEILEIKKTSPPLKTLVGACIGGLLTLLGIFMRMRTQGPPSRVRNEIREKQMHTQYYK